MLRLNSSAYDPLSDSAGAIKCAGPETGMWGHSMISSARTKMVSDRDSPRNLAKRWLTTSAKRVGCSTGSSAGLAPLMIRWIYVAACRYTSWAS